MTSYVHPNTPVWPRGGVNVTRASVVTRAVPPGAPRRADERRPLAGRVAVVAQHVERDRHVDLGGGRVVAGERRRGDRFGQHPDGDLAGGLVPVAVVDHVGETIEHGVVVGPDRAGDVLDRLPLT